MLIIFPRQSWYYKLHLTTIISLNHGITYIIDPKSNMDFYYSPGLNWLYPLYIIDQTSNMDFNYSPGRDNFVFLFEFTYSCRLLCILCIPFVKVK